ncbi:EscU/YscU/HrcU family type III secretion system export apparatus switch protein [Roseovarius amoyensis]|uniref:EscU/YscU/HrcU family type III secretion system export apparatus switch protein n=1 Tax=Roseovarius amoyensis TaxID=2211448 RepID=UPI000DBE4587|nr:flagellar type III secretion system protein FlhB [Roseovarius amoyensis]
MSGADDDTEKSHEPTEHKLLEARKKGDIARSADLTTAAAYGGLLLALLSAGPASVTRLGDVLAGLIGRADPLARLVFDGPAAAPVGGLLIAVAGALTTVLLMPPAFALLSVIGQRGLVMAPDKLRPRLSRIDPIQNARKKYGPSGLFEFAKSLAKLLLYSVVLGVFLAARMSDTAGALHAEPHLIGALMTRMVVEFLGIVLPVALAIGAVDLIWQNFDHRRRLRMSHKELRDEHKNHEGDPHFKQERRQRGQRIAAGQMMRDVPQADVVIVNPTHFAVALKWSRLPGSAPVCVAKGVDHVAHAIRDLAQESGVPIRNDPPTARALYATTAIGEEIESEHYRAVAAAIRFAERMRARARTFG